MRLAVSAAVALALLLSPAAAWSQTLADGLYAEIRTNKGLIVARLEPERVPMTVSSFVGLAEGTIDNDALDTGEPYYDGSVFGRVVPGHVIQAGSPDPGKSAARSPGYSFPNEIHADLSHDHAGALGIANGGPHTNNAQFYITLDDRSYLDGDYIVFGDVVAGMDVVYSIVQGDVIESVRIVRRGDRAEAFHPTTAAFRQLVVEAEARTDGDTADRVQLEAEYLARNIVGPAMRSGAVPALRRRGTNGVQALVRRYGDGPALVPGDRVSVRYIATALRYRGHMLNVTGPLFEEIRFVGSLDGGEPEFLDGPAPVFEYEVGATKINDRFDAAIAEMRRGEQRLVSIRAAYGRGGYYGPNVPGEPRLVIPPNTVVIYGIEVLRD